MVGKHRGVRLLEQDVKVYEKTLEKRLRDKMRRLMKNSLDSSSTLTADVIFVL